MSRKRYSPEEIVNKLREADVLLAKGQTVAQACKRIGVSGGRPLASREGGKRLLAAIREQRADSVVLLKLDRGFRNAADCLATVEQWECKGVALRIVDSGGNAIDTTSAAGRFMLVVLAGAAEMERDLTRERTKSAVAVKRANGQRVGTVPYGYDLADEGVTLVENPTEQTIIQDIQAMCSRGTALKQIAAEPPVVCLLRPPNRHTGHIRPWPESSHVAS